MCCTLDDIPYIELATELSVNLHIPAPGKQCDLFGGDCLDLSPVKGEYGNEGFRGGFTQRTWARTSND